MYCAILQGPPGWPIRRAVTHASAAPRGLDATISPPPTGEDRPRRRPPCGRTCSPASDLSDLPQRYPIREAARGAAVSRAPVRAGPVRTALVAGASAGAPDVPGEGCPRTRGPVLAPGHGVSLPALPPRLPRRGTGGLSAAAAAARAASAAAVGAAAVSAAAVSPARGGGRCLGLPCLGLPLRER